MTLARGFLLALLVFPIGFATHEVAHLTIWSALGYSPVMLVTPGQAPLLGGVTVFGVHVAVTGATPSWGLRLLNDFSAPMVAAVLLGILSATAPRGALRVALFANALAQVFFALIESGDVLADRAGLPTDFLFWPEVNYGPVLLILVAVVFIGLHATHRHPPKGRAGVY